MKTRSLGFVAIALTSMMAAGMAVASPIVSGFNSSTLARNDDGSTGLVATGLNMNYFGTTYSQLYVNNNGNVTFNGPLGTFTPFGLTSNIGTPIIAPFFADVDTRYAGDPVTYGTGTFGGHSAFGVNWLNADYYFSSTSHSKKDNFQLILVDRSDTGAGNFDIVFNYGSMQWETGDASSGSGGLGGSCARVGYSNGTGDPGTNYELAGSGVCGSFIDGGSNQLMTATNVNDPGRLVYQVRNGQVINTVPLPASGVLLAGGLAVFLFGAKRRRKG